MSRKMYKKTTEYLRRRKKSRRESAHGNTARNESKKRDYDNFLIVAKNESAIRRRIEEVKEESLKRRSLGVKCEKVAFTVDIVAGEVSKEHKCKISGRMLSRILRVLSNARAKKAVMQGATVRQTDVLIGSPAKIENDCPALATNENEYPIYDENGNLIWYHYLLLEIKTGYMKHGVTEALPSRMLDIFNNRPMSPLRFVVAIRCDPIQDPDPNKCMTAEDVAINSEATLNRLLQGDIFRKGTKTKTDTEWFFQTDRSVKIVCDYFRKNIKKTLSLPVAIIPASLEENQLGFVADNKFDGYAKENMKARDEKNKENQQEREDNLNALSEFRRVASASR